MTIITYIAVANGQIRKVIELRFKTQRRQAEEHDRHDNMGGGPYQNPRETGKQAVS